ncbi:peptidase C15, pyroglutamyl peptidase I-like protein [Plenodomus tracheiphilus IPT5]|uniref:Peptidase C15, pyroglutamyl peptidase I-like protein n=1 Tax=Plenodomus tracheiphilus IPT5 TaxID=1408161 RepID=A0A6A7AYG0_9PLEO|nr:peptidase C15, pyroglutamyl peptidase I-like protein [Plenodomus tracheiphilus IPT5]
MTTTTKVLITGFGPFLDIANNPSWSIAKGLSNQMADIDGENVNIIVPNGPLPAAYHKIHAQIPALIAEHNPDLVLNIGVDVDSAPGVFKLEKSAKREGYHDIPDIDRRVFTRAENKKIFGKAAPSLHTSLDIETVVARWRGARFFLRLSDAANEAPKGKGKSNQGTPVDVQLSDDVGNYVCGFNYYVSMLEMQKLYGTRAVVFLHVPYLTSVEEITIGVQVVEELLKALVSVHRAQ